MQDVLGQKPKLRDTVENVVCVNNVPCIPEDKYSKVGIRSDDCIRDLAGTLHMPGVASWDCMHKKCTLLPIADYARGDTTFMYCCSWRRF